VKFLKAIFLLILVVFESCNLADADIKEQSWKYAEGFSIGDWIDFNTSTFLLSHDTIYVDKRPVAKIIFSSIGLFANKRFIKIESLQNKRKGIYLEK
jgi:hypothetical protein